MYVMYVDGFLVKFLFPSRIFHCEEEATALEGLKLTENALSTAQKVDPLYSVRLSLEDHETHLGRTQCQAHHKHELLEYSQLDVRPEDLHT